MPLVIPFSQLPGRHERHLRRRLCNPLFPRPVPELTDEILLEAQRLDHEELIAFVGQLRHLVQEAIDLPANVGSEVLLSLKGRLDQNYSLCAALADEQDNNRSAIEELTALIMRQLQQQAAGDSLAEAELAAEALARQAHYQLLKQPLVADLLHPQSLIEADELLPSLLGETGEAFSLVLELFDDQQLEALEQAAGQLIQHWPDKPDIQHRLAQIKAASSLSGLDR